MPPGLLVLFIPVTVCHIRGHFHQFFRNARGVLDRRVQVYECSIDFFRAGSLLTAGVGNLLDEPCGFPYLGNDMLDQLSRLPGCF